MYALSEINFEAFASTATLL